MTISTSFHICLVSHRSSLLPLLFSLAFSVCLSICFCHSFVFSLQTSLHVLATLATDGVSRVRLVARACVDELVAVIAFSATEAGSLALRAQARLGAIVTSFWIELG